MKEERKAVQKNGWIVESAVGIGLCLRLKDEVDLVGKGERV